MNDLILLGIAAISAVLLAVALFVARLAVRADRRLLAIEQQCLDLVQAGGETSERLRWLDQANADLLRHVDRLAADVIHRELYRDRGNRQTLAMEAVSAGVSLETLVAEHGLSSEEAELLMSLQVGGVRSDRASASI